MAATLAPYLPWIAWTFVPSLATTFTLKLLYTSSLLARPQTPSSAHKQSSAVRALLVSVYLVWSFYARFSAHQPSAYGLLGVDLDVSVEQVKKAFRRMAIIYHPDKVGAQGEKFFIAIRRSHDVLSDPVKRFAYDRFGFGVLDWKDAISYREHMVVGLRSTLAFWISNPFIYAIISWLSSDNTPFSYWHLTFLFGLIVAEVNLIIAPRRPAVLQWLVPEMTVHEVVMLLRQVYTSSIMAARQLLPFISFPEEKLLQGPKTLKEAQDFLDALTGEMGKLQEMANALEESTQKAWEAEVQPLCLGTRQQSSVGRSSSDSTRSEVTGEGSDASAAKTRQPTKLHERYSHLVSNSLLLQSIEGVTPGFRQRHLLPQGREIFQQTSGASGVSVRPAGAGSGQDAAKEGTIASSVDRGTEKSAASTDALVEPCGP